MKRREFKSKLYLGLSLKNFIAEAELLCDVYIYLPVNDKMVKIAKNGQSINSSRILNYESKNLEYLFILEPHENPNSYRVTNPEAMNPILPPGYLSDDPKVRSYEGIEEIEGSEKEWTEAEDDKDRTEKEWTEAEDDKDRTEKKEWTEAEDDNNRTEKEWTEAEEEKRIRNGFIEGEEERKVRGTPEESDETEKRFDQKESKDKAESRFGSEKLSTDHMQRVSGSKEEADNFSRRIGGGSEEEKGEYRVHSSTQSKDERRFAAGQNSEKEDAFVVKGDSEEKDAKFNLAVRPYSKEAENKSEDRFKVSSSLNEVETKSDKEFAIRVDQSELNAHLSEQANRANEIIRIKSGEGDSGDLMAKREVKSLFGKEAANEIRELQDKLGIPEHIQKMSADKLHHFSNQERYAAEEVALLEGELGARVELNKAMLIMVKTNPNDVSESEFRTFVTETEQTVKRSLTARAVVERLTAKRKEFCDTDPEDEKKRVALMEEIEKLQEDVVNLATNPNYDLKKIDVDHDAIDAGWIKTDFKEEKETQLTRIEEKLIEITKNIAPSKESMRNEQNNYAEKLRNENGSLELTSLIRSLPLNKRVFHKVNHALTFALASGYRKPSSLKKFALVALTEFAGSELELSKIPEEVVKLRSKLMEQSNKKGMWFRDMNSILNMTDRYIRASAGADDRFAPDIQFLKDAEQTILKDGDISPELFHSSKNYVESKKPNTLVEIPLEITTFAAWELDSWLNPNVEPVTTSEHTETEAAS